MSTTSGDTRSIAEALDDNRARLFVGRRDELAACDRLLSPAHPCRVLFFHGPGGIGKTTLLRAALARARAAGWKVAELDARAVPPDPVAARMALSQAMGAATPTGDERLLLAIDTFEEWAAMEGWLRNEFLPSLFGSAHVLIAGRQPPGLRWRSDGGWDGLLDHRAVSPFSAEEARDYLTRRGVEAEARGRAAEVSRGHPLLLALLADALGSSELTDLSETLFDRAIDEQLISLVDHLVPAGTRWEERATLFACALLRHTSEDLLARMVDVDAARARSLFEWLEQLSFVDADPIGAYPHDVMRGALRTALERREPDLRTSLLDAAVAHYLERIRSSGDPVLLAEHLYLYSNFMPPIYPDPTGDLEPSYAERARPQDVPAMRAMVVRHEGEEQVRLFDFWWQHQPTAFRAVRGSDEVVTGFFILLELRDPPAEWLAGDALMARFWAEGARLDRPLQKDESAVLLRMWMHREQHMRPSPVAPLWSVELARTLLLTPGISMGAAVHPDSADWVANSLLYGHRELEGSQVHSGDEPTVAYLHDFSNETILEWLEHTYQRYRETLVDTAPAAAPIEPGELRLALRQIHRPDRLASHPLAARVGGEDPVTALRARIEEECQVLRHNPKTEVLFRVIDRTYLRPAHDQRAAAESCGLSWDQYRRRLTESIKLLSARLERSLS